MNTNHFIVIVFLFFSAFGLAQDVQRIEIQGKIIVDRNDLEGVTVFNKSSNKGTVTDKEGLFTIDVALNDQLEFSALQFQNFTVTISQEIIDRKELTAYLVEQINKLDEVLILPHKLTGDLFTDTQSVELVNPNLDALYFGLDNLDKIEFLDDHLTGVHNIAMPERRLVYGVNMVDVVGLLFKSIFKPKEKKIVAPSEYRKSILEVYTKEYLSLILNIKNEDIVEFVYYVEENEFDISLLGPKREFEFIDFLKQKEKEFVTIKYGKN